MKNNSDNAPIPESCLASVSSSDNSDLFYKWLDGDDIYCARVILSYDKQKLIGNYYKNGEIYANYQSFIKKDTDIEISEKEFDKLVGF